MTLREIHALQKKLTPSYVAKSIHSPVERWPGNCYGVASKMQKAKIVPGGVAVYGHWLGAISPMSLFAARSGLGFCNHGWLVVGDVIVDPTRWVFEAAEPYIYVGKNDGLYDEGGNKWRALMLRPPPAVKPDEPRDSFVFEPPIVKWLVEQLRDDAVATERGLTHNQMFWVANLPLNALGEYAEPVYAWLKRQGRSALVPIDNWRAVERRRKEGRYK